MSCNKKTYVMFVVLFVFSHILGFSESLKSYADFYFSSKTWTNPSREQIEIQPSIVPGGGEGFSYLKLQNDFSESVIFPYCDGLGSLDYSDLDRFFLDLCVSFKNQLLERNIDKTLCNLEYPYISIIAQYQLEKLPLFKTVVFSSATQDSNNNYFVRFRLGKFQDKEYPYIFVGVKIIKQEAMFVIQEIEFEWDSYVANSR